MAQKMFIFALCSVALLGAAAIAQPTPTVGKDGWVMVTAADLAGTPDLAMRQKDTFNLQASADFDGDLLEDRVSVRKNARLAQYGVFACLARADAGPCNDMMITSGPMKHLSNLGVNAVAAATPECGKMAARGTPACIEVFAFEASSTLYRWNGSKFVERQVTD